MYYLGYIRFLYSVTLKAMNIKMVAARIAKIANFPLSAIAFICL